MVEQVYNNLMNFKVISVLIQIIYKMTILIQM